MLRAILAYGPPALAWAAVAYKLPALRRSPRDPALRAYWLTLLSLALALTVLVDAVYLAIDRVAGVPNLARLLGHGFILVTSWAVQAFLLHLNYLDGAARPRVRRYGWGLAVALVLMATLFGLAPVDEESLQFMSRYADAPFILEYWLVFLGYLGLALVNVVRLSWRYAGRTDRVAVRLGLRVSATGGAIGLGYVVHEGLYVLARRAGLGYPLPDKELVTTVLVAGGTSLLIVGSTMPAWGPRVGIPALWHWIGRYRTYRRLYPLWLALYRSSPEIALSPPPSRLADALAVRDLGFRLYRRVIEIRDGLLALRPYVDPRALDETRALGRQAGLSGDELDAVAEAAGIASALRAKSRGRRAGAAHLALGTPGGAGLSGETAFLERVARAYRRSPLVRIVLARLEREYAESGRVERGPGQR